jgi:hypothetical protein
VDIQINGIPAKTFDMWVIGDHHVVIQGSPGEGAIGDLFVASRISYLGKGGMTITPIDDNANHFTLTDAVQAVRHDRDEQGLPKI